MVGEQRYDIYGEFRLMAEADGYVMARRHDRRPLARRPPFVVTRKEWDSWSLEPCGRFAKEEAIIVSRGEFERLKALSEKPAPPALAVIDGANLLDRLRKE